MTPDLHDPTGKLISELKKDFVVIHKSRVRAVWAYLVIALILGVGIGVGYVIGQKGEFQASEASTLSGGMAGNNSHVLYVNSTGDGGEKYAIAGGVTGTAVRLNSPPARWVPFGTRLVGKGGGWIGVNAMDSKPAVGFTPRIVTFTEEFTPPSENILSASLIIAAVDGYDVSLNGELLYVRNCLSRDSCFPYFYGVTIPAEKIKPGQKNVLEIRNPQAGRGGAPGGVIYGLTITSRPYEIPTCTISMDKSSYVVGDTIKLSWSSWGATNAVFGTDSSGKDTLLTHPGDQLDLSGSRAIVASIIGNPSVWIVVSGPGGKSNCSITIPIAGTTTAQPVFRVISSTVNKTIGSVTVEFKFAIMAKDGDVVFTQQNPFIVSLLNAGTNVTENVNVQKDVTMNGECDLSSDAQSRTIRNGGTCTVSYKGIVNTSGWPANKDGLYYFALTGFKWTGDSGKQPQGMSEVKTNNFYISEQKDGGAKTVTITNPLYGYGITYNNSYKITWSTNGFSANAVTNVVLIGGGKTYSLLQNIPNTGTASPTIYADSRSAGVPEGRYTMQICVKEASDNAPTCSSVSNILVSFKG